MKKCLVRRVPTSWDMIRKIPQLNCQRLVIREDFTSLTHTHTHISTGSTAIWQSFVTFISVVYVLVPQYATSQHVSCSRTRMDSWNEEEKNAHSNNSYYDCVRVRCEQRHKCHFASASPRPVRRSHSINDHLILNICAAATLPLSACPPPALHRLTFITPFRAFTVEMELHSLSLRREMDSGCAFIC